MSDNDILQAIDSAIEQLAPVQLAADLVRIPSHPGIERQEERVVMALGRFFGERDLSVQLEEILPGRPNLLVSIAGDRPGAAPAVVRTHRHRAAQLWRPWRRALRRDP